MEDASPNPPDFETSVRGYFANMIRNGGAPGTEQSYSYYLTLYGQWLNGRALSEIKAREIELDYLAGWEAEYGRMYGKPPATNTVRAHLAALASFYNWLVKMDLAPSNPMAKIDRPKRKRKSNDALSLSEFNAVLEAPINASERIIVSLLAFSALRVSEATGLKQGDVNSVIRVRQSKSEAGERSIPILPELQVELDRWLAHLESRGLRGPDMPVLITSTGEEMGHNFVRNVLKRVCARAGVRVREATDKAGKNVSEVSPHTLRRTLATLLINGSLGKAVRVEAVQALLGHANASTTLSYYASLSQETVASEILAAVS